MDKVKEMTTWSRVQVTERMEYLQRMSEIARERVIVSDSDAAKTLVGELEARLGQVRSAYLAIDATSFPTAVVAHLESLQGQEREIGIQIEMWKNSRDAKKRLDEELLMCENVLKDKDSRSF